MLDSMDSGGIQHELPITKPAPTGLAMQPRLPICQSTLPLDWYQEAFQPYAQEYLALPDQRPDTVLPWLNSYVEPALAHFGDELLLLAHFYMGGEIVKLVERYGGAVADSYALALQARANPQAKIIVESAVHFMAETIAILARDDQDVWITNPKAGCTMEMMAKDWMVLPVVESLVEKHDLLVISYMNTSGRLKALAGRTGGAVCTSSNAHLVVDWARQQGRRILFLPDHHLGRNTAWRLGMDLDRVRALPDPRTLPADWQPDDATLNDAEMILWGGFCGVHTVFSAEQVAWWQERGWTVLVHPESPLEVVKHADGSGSTAYLWKAITEASPGSRIAIGTEGHFVRNAREHAATRNVQIEHLADIPGQAGTAGCGCATMSRNDPPHLAGMLDLLRQGQPPELNKVEAGDVIDEGTGTRTRLEASQRDALKGEATQALEQMIAITERKTNT
ncbi:MAG: quinolinate synthase NadA [Planctomycetota bacterium]|nr:quinolinate synthase NadA [Planctomycetota bacterium]